MHHNTPIPTINQLINAFIVQSGFDRTFLWYSEDADRKGKDLTTPWDQRFFTSSRGQIVALLRRSARTVEELAKALDLTLNAVRVHLAALGRDGLVQQRGTVSRSTSGKPAYVYELTPAAENLFPKAYEPMLRELLGVLGEQLTSEESRALLSRVGRRMARGRTVAQGGLSAQLEACVEILNNLGGLAEVEERNGTFIIRSYNCPASAVVVEHPEVCRVMETLLNELMDAAVSEHCDREGRPQCCFEAAPSSDPMRR